MSFLRATIGCEACPLHCTSCALRSRKSQWPRCRDSLGCRNHEVGRRSLPQPRSAAPANTPPFLVSSTPGWPINVRRLEALRPGRVLLRDSCHYLLKLISRGVSGPSQQACSPRNNLGPVPYTLLSAATLEPRLATDTSRGRISQNRRARVSDVFTAEELSYHASS